MYFAMLAVGLVLLFASWSLVGLPLAAVVLVVLAAGAAAWPLRSRQSSPRS